MASSFLCFSLLFISLFTADGFMYYVVERCVFNSTELSNIEYVKSWYCNKLEFLRFDSSVGRFVGFTELGVKNAARLNKDQAQLNVTRAQKGTYCQPNVGSWYQGVLSRSAQPNIRLRSTTPLSSHHPTMLVCSVYDFYPKRIKVSWLRDGQEVSSDVTSTEELADGDWYYQTHSHLEYTPRTGEKISCVVEHASLKEPVRTDWDPSSRSFMPASEWYKFAIGASGVMLGLILCLGGFIYYKRKDRGYSLISTK